MRDFIKKGASGAASLSGSAIKAAFGSIISEITKDILEETGVTDIAKDKLMDVGFKVIKDMDIDPKSVQRDLIKTAIMKELNL